MAALFDLLLVVDRYRSLHHYADQDSSADPSPDFLSNSVALDECPNTLHLAF